MLYFSHLLEDNDMEQLCKKYNAGLEVIEFSIGENLKNVEKTLVQYEKRLAHINPPALTLHGPFVDMSPISYDSDIAAITYKRFHAAHFAAKKLGAKKMIIHTCLVPQIYYIDTWIERTVDFWNYFLDGHHDITICLENVLDTVPAPMAEVAKKVDSEELKLCLDFGHAHTFSTTPVQKWASVLYPYLSHLHIHDNNKDADSHLSLGNGSINLEETFANLHMPQQCLDMTLEHASIQAIDDTMHWLDVHHLN